MLRFTFQLPSRYVHTKMRYSCHLWQHLLTLFKNSGSRKYQWHICEAYLCFDKHTWQISRDLLKSHVAVGVLQQGLRCMVAMDQDYLETMAMAQVAQFTWKVHISCQQCKDESGYHRIIFGDKAVMVTTITVTMKLNSHDTRTTVAGAVWVSAKRRKLWRSLSSAAFLAVALICATVTWWSKSMFTHWQTSLFPTLLCFPFAIHMIWKCMAWNK